MPLSLEDKAAGLLIVRLGNNLPPAVTASEQEAEVADLLDRLHVMVAPMIIGSGRPAFSLPEIKKLDSALRPKAQMVDLGSDMLFDLDFTRSTVDE